MRYRLSPHGAYIGVVTVMLAFETKHCPILFVVHVVLRKNLATFFLTERVFLTISTLMT